MRMPTRRSGWRWALESVEKTGTFAVVLAGVLALPGTGALPARGAILPLEPAPGTVLLAPQTTARIAFEPPLEPGASARVLLFAGIDDPDRDRVVDPVDVSAAAVLAADGSELTLELADLPPGRSALEVERVGGALDGEAGVLLLDRGGLTRVGPAPFRAGVRTFEVERPSTGDPAVSRRFDLVVWYPTESTAPEDPATEAVPDAPVAAGAASLPVVLFSHGSCGSPLQSTFLTAGFARRGYLVAAMEHPGNTFLDPDCSDPVELARAFVERPDDVRAALDWLLAESASPAGVLRGLVDAGRVGLTGHSFGGQTTVRVAAVEPRIRAAMPLAPEFAFTAPLVRPLLPLAVPVLVQGGALDTTTPFETHQRPLFEALTAPRMLLEILAADHGGFTRFAPPEIRALVERYAYAFFGVYLARDRRHDADLVPVPGVALTADRNPLPDPPPCANGLDDDGDGRIDAISDPGCNGRAEAEESLTIPLAGRRLLLRDPPRAADRRLLALVARARDLPLPGPGEAGDPRSAGAALTVQGAAGGSLRVELPAAGWSALAGGGYRYRGGGSGLGPCRIAVLTGRGLRVLCRGAEAAMALDAPAQEAVAVTFEVGSEVRYCLLFGGEVRSDRGRGARSAGLFAAREAPPPPACAPAPGP